MEALNRSIDDALVKAGNDLLKRHTELRKTNKRLREELKEHFIAAAMAEDRVRILEEKLEALQNEKKKKKKTTRAKKPKSNRELDALYKDHEAFSWYKY